VPKCKIFVGIQNVYAVYTFVRSYGHIMLTEYIQAAMAKAKYEIIEDDGTYYGRIPGFKGVWANETTLEECRQELKDVLEEWIVLGIRFDHRLPSVSGIRIKLPRTSQKQAG